MSNLKLHRWVLKYKGFRKTVHYLLTLDYKTNLRLQPTIAYSSYVIFIKNMIELIEDETGKGYEWFESIQFGKIRVN